MDGRKGRLTGSVQRRLSLALSGVILLVAVTAGAFSFMSAFDEAHELQDETLRQVATLMEHRRLSPDLPVGEARPYQDDEGNDARVIVQTVGQQDGTALSVDQGGVLPLPAALAEGMQTLEAGGDVFRVLVRTLSDGSRIAVSQEADLRDEVALDSALRTIMPLLLLVPILQLVVAHLVGKLFRPIARLSGEIDRRDEGDLRPVPDDDLPAEIRPFTVAINRLLVRVGRSMETQRRFIADAAHELRSPLTALSLQAERLAEAEMPEEARERVSTLRQGIDRGRNLLDQLLALARAQSANAEPCPPLSVQEIYRRVLEDLMPLAEARRIDIGVEGDRDLHVRVAALDMVTLVRNLIDNAIRYTPEGGRVDLSVGLQGGYAELRVRDTGPGIPMAEWERVFDPFHRRLGSNQIGSGLGLSIVKAIADRIGARVILSFTDADAQSGLTVQVLIPLGDG